MWCAGEPSYLAAWRRICDASRKEFSSVYARLNVTLTERGESFYNPMLKVRGREGLGEGGRDGEREGVWMSTSCV